MKKMEHGHGESVRVLVLPLPLGEELRSLIYDSSSRILKRSKACRAITSAQTQSHAAKRSDDASQCKWILKKKILQM